MTNKFLFALLSILVIAVVVFFGASLFIPMKLTGLFAFDEDEVASKVENLYELANPGVTTTVEKFEERSGIFKVLLRIVDADDNTDFREIYVTRDGELLTESVILVSSSINQIKRISNFTDCIYNKGVRIFGVSNDTATTLQFNLLGGPYATKLYVSCDGDLAQQCIALNVTYVPTVVYGNTGYPGVQSVQFLENMTSCTF